MAGGTWATQNKIRPGVYIRFKTNGGLPLSVSDRGIVAIAQAMSWGQTGDIVEVEKGADTTPFCGYPITDPNARFLNEIFKGSNRTNPPYKVLLYRLAGVGAAAAAVSIPESGSGVTATAVYPGARGNDIVITITNDPDDSEQFTVYTVVDGEITDQQTVKTVAELTANDWVAFTGNGPLSATTGAALTGGADGTVANTAYTQFLEKLEPYAFDVLIYDGDNPTIQGAYQNFVERMANDNGSYGQLVTAGMQNPDSRFVINVGAGVVLNDGSPNGVTLTPQQATWWAGGAEAGAQYNESLTYATYPGVTDVTPKMTNSEYVAALQAGQLVFFEDNGAVKVEQDINSLVSYTPDIGKVYHKNRVMRLCNTIANDLYKQFSQNYVGVVNNNARGRSMFKSAIVGYMLTLQGQEAIQNFSADDVSVEPGTEGDAIVVFLAVQSVDSIEKIYMTVEMA